MASVNKVILVGNLGRDPEVRYTATGDAMCNLSIATTDNWRDKASGERKEHTEWHSVVCYRQQADFVRDFLGKGRQIYVEGILRTRKWADKQGIERYTTEIRVDSVQPLGPRPDGVGGSASNDRAGQGKGNEAPPAGGFPEGADDDLPY